MYNHTGGRHECQSRFPKAYSTGISPDVVVNGAEDEVLGRSMGYFWKASYGKFSVVCEMQDPWKFYVRK